MPEDASLRFTILEHDHPFLHWDLLMQHGESLNAWRLLNRPQRGEWIASELLPNHRLIYLDYEGPVSGNRGSVSQFCTGRYSSEAVHADSATKTFVLYSCEFATRLVCREFGNTAPSWRFE